MENERELNLNELHQRRLAIRSEIERQELFVRLLKTLTPQQREVCLMIRLGIPHTEIAIVMQTTKQNIERYEQKIVAKANKIKPES